MSPTVTIIPARAHSKRFPGKNTHPLAGKPLICHSVEFALANAEICGTIVVCTNDQKVKEAVQSYPITVLDRPEAISGDHEPTVTVLQYVLDQMAVEAGHVILLQPTNPLRPESLLREAWNAYRNSGRRSLFTVTPCYDKLGHLEGERFVPLNYAPGQRSQDLKPLYAENGLLYISEAGLLQSGAVFDADAFPFVVADLCGKIDIDTPHDMELAQAFAKNGYGLNLRT